MKNVKFYIGVGSSYFQKGKNVILMGLVKLLSLLNIGNSSKTSNFVLKNSCEDGQPCLKASTATNSKISIKNQTFILLSGLELAKNVIKVAAVLEILSL